MYTFERSSPPLVDTNDESETKLKNADENQVTEESDHSLIRQSDAPSRGSISEFGNSVVQHLGQVLQSDESSVVINSAK